MKVTIALNQSSIDPQAIYGRQDFATVRSVLESEYSEAIRSRFPSVQLRFVEGWQSIRITDIDPEDPPDTEATVERLCEDVFRAGDFWV